MPSSLPASAGSVSADWAGTDEGGSSPSTAQEESPAAAHSTSANAATRLNGRFHRKAKPPLAPGRRVHRAASA